MTFLSYPERFLLLQKQLDNEPPPTIKAAFEVCGRTDKSTSAIRDVKFDIRLLRLLHETKGKPATSVSSDGPHTVNNLGLNRADFVTIGRAGEGQFGTVDAVRCTLNGGIYALKTIAKITAIRSGPLHIVSSVRQSSNTSSPVPRLLAAFQDIDNLYMVIDYIPCGTLWDRLCQTTLDSHDPDQSFEGEKLKPMEEEEIRWCGFQMIKAISWVHAVGFVHRDIKPHNFLIGENYQIKLTDFGSSVPLLSTSHPEARRTASGMIHKDYCALPAGTPDYVSPEVLTFAEEAAYAAAMMEDGDRTMRPGDAIVEEGYDWGVDWWSFGATIYEMSTGKAPFWARTVDQTYGRILGWKDTLHIPPELSEELQHLISSLLTAPENRLGRRISIEILNHPFFSQIRQHGPNLILPEDIEAPPIMELVNPQSAAEYTFAQGQTFDEFTFDHFFHSTTSAFSSLTISNSMTRPANDPKPWERWVGWTWHPPPRLLDNPPKYNIPISNWTFVSPFSAHVTPIRGNTSTPLRTPTPGSVIRTRPISERQAFSQLMKCVQSSAKKRVRQSRSSRSKMTSGGLYQTMDMPGSSYMITSQTPTPTTRVQATSYKPPNLSPPKEYRSEEAKDGIRLSITDAKWVDKISTGSDWRGSVSLSELEAWHKDIEHGIENLNTKFRRLSSRLRPEESDHP
ncbi:hypothetical protein TREMEDRAFT_60436 [Tremella mesenterica DSM 1558]|uniref:uncharacterized protein n=1 Tax=Tremella mesenterica (strain ATCC 24925 / CBS 8224 / DSM 1558 / NBRC 9311 / NRRL Y-6157 / RJB 2259-6 / UBC 559-6) TaxID=578456 RepID=UPI0003F49E1C|nr:uncharacterized protein TREMEDRAFT_60436 [Tremella mesenterica DSM 1558]EIW71511.1 hypothetical protein TREMEDRAFT_60436 [Tremella mesenterica DSM 1558]